MNGTSLEDADHLKAVKTLRNAGSLINMVVSREVAVFTAPENPPILSTSELQPQYDTTQVEVECIMKTSNFNPGVYKPILDLQQKVRNRIAHTHSQIP